VYITSVWVCYDIRRDTYIHTRPCGIGPASSPLCSALTGRLVGPQEVARPISYVLALWELAVKNEEFNAARVLVVFSKKITVSFWRNQNRNAKIGYFDLLYITGKL